MHRLRHACVVLIGASLTGAALAGPAQAAIQTFQITSARDGKSPLARVWFDDRTDTFKVWNHSPPRERWDVELVVYGYSTSRGCVVRAGAARNWTICRYALGGTRRINILLFQVSAVHGGWGRRATTSFANTP